METFPGLRAGEGEIFLRSLMLFGHAVDTDGDRKDETLDDHLRIFADVHEDHAVGQGADDQNARDNAGHTADTAVDGDTA